MKSSTSNIGVIITVYNKEKWIRRALDSLICQNIMPDQIIIVNDCSKDNSEKIILDTIPLFEEKTEVLYISLQENQGAAQARNIALKELKTNYASFLDADDQYTPNHIQTLIKIIRKYPDIGMISSAVKKERNGYIYPSKTLIDTFQSLDEIYEITNCYRSLAKESFFIGGGNVCFNTSLTDGISFKIGEQNFEEWDFYYRILLISLEKKLKIIFSPSIGLIYNDMDETSLSRSIIQNPESITVPQLILRLNKDDEFGYRKYVISLWLFNSLSRLNSLKSKLRFLYLQKNYIKHLPINRYSIGSFLLLIFPKSLIQSIKELIKDKRFKK